MKFFKYYAPLMLQLLGTQVIISLLSNMLYGTLHDLPILLIIGTVLALGIYFYLQFHTVWEHACKESIKHPDSQQHIGPVTGLIVGLVSGLPAFLLNLIPILTPMHITETGDLSGGLSQAIYSIAKFFFNGQYIAIIQSVFPLQVLEVQNSAAAAQNAQNILASLPYYLLTIIPVALVTWFGYWLGLRDQTIASWLGLDFKPRPKKDQKKQK